MKKVRVWDLPTRLFHWSLVTTVVAAVVAQKIGGNAMAWHFRFGYAALTLVLFRVVWGFIGTWHARFSSFVASPAAVWAYLRAQKNGSASKYAGHNPIGSWSVLALLGIILLQAGTGLFSNDDIASEGPLVKFISKALSDKFSGFHSDISGNLIYALVGLHVVAIAYYYFKKKEDLITPMISGDKLETAEEIRPVDDSWKTWILALIIFSLCIVGVVCLVNA